jgi:multidrug efflux pump subunit AcrA (membrane-fusion protein)
VQAPAGDLVVSLPGTTSAFAAANIFARASGYVEQRNVDIGDRVKAGQLLATIVAPELDHQIAQARIRKNSMRCCSPRDSRSWAERRCSGSASIRRRRAWSTLWAGREFTSALLPTGRPGSGLDCPRTKKNSAAWQRR